MLCLFSQSWFASVNYSPLGDITMVLSSWSDFVYLVLRVILHLNELVLHYENLIWKLIEYPWGTYRSTHSMRHHRMPIHIYGRMAAKHPSICALRT
jgi:hypothetical protein